MRSLSAQEPDSGGEGAAFAGGEGGLGVGEGIDDVVDYVGIAAAGDVVEAAAQRQIVSEKVKAFFELEVEREILGETLCAGRADELLLIGEKIVWESGAGFCGVGDFELMDYGKFEQREISPGEKTVRSIPGIRAGLLRAEDGTVDIEVEGLIGAGAGASVGAHDHVGFAEVVAKSELEGLVMIVATCSEERSRRRENRWECCRRIRGCRGDRGIRLSDKLRRGVSFPERGSS